MVLNNLLILKLSLILGIVFLSSCTSDTGYEFMPNMYRSPSLGTYGQNSYFSDSLNARKPVKGTIARNYLSTFYYESSLEEYLRAGNEAINPFEGSEENTVRPSLFAVSLTSCIF